MLAKRRPEVRIRRAEQGDRGSSDRRRKVGNSRIVPDEKRASIQCLAQVR